MKRRSGSRKPAKARLTTKLREGSARRPNRPVAELQKQLRALASELAEAREQQTATSEVLQVVSSSPGDLEPVFETMLAKAVRICDAKFGVLALREGDAFRVAAMHNPPSAYAELRRRKPLIRPEPLAGIAATKQPLHIPDITELPAYKQRDPDLVVFVELAEARTSLTMPLLREQELIGFMSIYRQEVRPFTDKQIEVVKNFAAQAVIAIENARLLNELRQRTDDLTESLEQQTATSDVLKIISSSRGDLPPVFESVLANATRLCEATFGTLLLRETGKRYRVVAMYNPPPAYAELRQREPVTEIGPEAPLARAAVIKTAIQVADFTETLSYKQREPSSIALGDLAGARTFVVVPMLQENELVGAIVIYRQEVRPFTDKQVELLTNFADQAVIAIENARLLNELRQRTNDLTESLEQQTATSEVLQVVSGSPGEVEPVFRAMAEKAVRICGAAFGSIYRWDGAALQLVASHNSPPALAEAYRRLYRYGDPQSPLGRVIATKSTVHVMDASAEETYLNRTNPTLIAAVELAGLRTLLCVPMLKEGALIGAFTLSRQEVRAFTDKQIELVKNFAAQAVIAIENARLLNELRERTDDLTESLEQQTAMSEVLQVISHSPGELQRVFDVILNNALRICDAHNATLWLDDDGNVRRAARVKEIDVEVPVRPSATSLLIRAMQTNQSVQVEDIRMEQSYHEGDAFMVAAVDRLGIRTYLAVPMLKDGKSIGAISLYRREVRPFTNKQIELVTNFAAQAVIAIENARLLGELRESLAQQTATSEVLRVISSSPADLQPVFTSMLENAVHICGASFGSIYRWGADAFQLVARHDPPAAYAEAPKLSDYRPDERTPLGRLFTTKQAIHVADLSVDRCYVERPAPEIAAVVDVAGVRTVLAVPIMRESELVGAFILFRQEIRPFNDKQMELVKNFAAQAVIAIENARLLTELRESLEQQTATAEVLQVINSSPGNLAPVFDVILKKAHSLCGAAHGAMFLCDGDYFRAVTQRGMPDSFMERLRQGFHGREAPVTSPLLAGEPFVHIGDLARVDHPITQAAVQLAGTHTLLSVPLRKDDALLGMIVAARREVRPFSATEIALLQNFGAQAVIAIENARLLNELRARTADLTESLEQQTATSEILASISGSMMDSQPVFDAIVRNLLRLFGTRYAVVQLLRDGMINIGAVGGEQGFEKLTDYYPRPLDDSTIGGHAMLARQVVQIAGVLDNPHAPAAHLQFARDFGFNSTIAAPMLQGDDVIGAIVTAHRESKAFNDKQVALMRAFADQAVIAIENKRLLTELRESLEQQTATSEVLQVISSSPGELGSVFQTILQNATRLCEASFGNMVLYEAGLLRRVAFHNAPPEYAEYNENHPLLDPEKIPSLGKLVRTRRPVHMINMASDEPESPIYRFGGARTLLVVPMLKEDVFIGGIGIYRKEVRPFTDKQIALVANFAAQAVIAIENARLLNELRQRTDDLGRSVGELRALGEVSQAVNSTLDLEAVLSTIVSKAVQLSSTEGGAIYVFEPLQREFHLRATYGMDQELITALTDQHIRIDEPIVAQVLAQPEPIQVPDLREGEPSAVNELILRAGFRALLIAPLRGGDDLVGMLVVRRRTPGAFAPNTIDLMKTFAAQSALAIQNARLFHEIEDKGRQLEVASQHKSQFLANMSHELRTPLNAILGYTELIADGAYGEPSDKMLEVLKRLEANGRHLLGLINDVLDLSKIEAGQLELELSDYSLEDIAQVVRNTLEPLAADKKLAFKVEMPARLPPGHGDGRRLTQVLINLVGNAIKFTDAGEVAIKAEANHGAFYVSVRDTGPGISAADQAKLFQEFQQADNAITKKKGGTGLGLAISKRIIEMHGGRIWVDSQPGQGSTFAFTLPVTVERQVGVA